jgi:hypothetical protein
MSPTYFAVHMAAAEKRLKTARAVSNIPAMQSALAEQIQLIRAYYGAPRTL